MAEDLMQSQDPMQQQFPGGGPPPFMQGAINPMMTGAPPQSGGVLPPSNPVDAAQGPQPDSNMMNDPRMRAAIIGASQTAAQGLQGREQAAMGPQMGGGLPDLIRQQQAQSGDLSTHPSFVHGQGAGGFFHNLGQALLALGLATKPGQAVDAAVHSKQRQEYAGRSEEIKALQKQQELTQQPEGALSNALYHGANIGINQQKADTAQQRADTYAEDVAAKSADRLVKEQQGWGRLTVAQQKQKLTDWYEHERVMLEGRGQDLGLTKAEIAAQTGRSIAAAIQGNSYIKEHPILYGVAQAIPGLKEYLPDMQAPEGAVTDTMKPGQSLPQGKAKAPSTPEASRAAGKGASAAPARPANVPPNYIYKKNGPKGEGWYRPGSM